MLDATREIYIVAPCHKMPTRAKQASNEVHKKKRNIFSLKKKIDTFSVFCPETIGYHLARFLSQLTMSEVSLCEPCQDTCPYSWSFPAYYYYSSRTRRNWVLPAKDMLLQPSRSTSVTVSLIRKKYGNETDVHQSSCSTKVVE